MDREVTLKWSDEGGEGGKGVHVWRIWDTVKKPSTARAKALGLSTDCQEMTVIGAQ